MGDKFKLHDLIVEVVGDPKTFVCGHRVGPAFEVIGEDLIFKSNPKFSLYSLAALLPLLPAKQRATDPNDWMTTDEDIACPDPNCGAKFRITRRGQSEFSHGGVTKVPLK